MTWFGSHFLLSNGTSGADRRVEMRRRVQGWKLVLLIGAIVAGFGLGTYGGIFALDILLDATGGVSGWGVLTGITGAPLTFGLLGAAMGAALVTGPEFNPDERRWLLAAAATAFAAAVIIWLAAGLFEAVAVFVWAFTAALLLWTFGTRRR